MRAAAVQHAGIFLRGMLIGVADLIPGVSGGTIAFITGIYERLLACIRNGSSPLVLLLLLRGKLSLFWRTVDGTFLAVLLAGAGLAILAGADLVHLLLTEHTARILAFFLGLTLSAAVWLARELRPRPGLFACGLAGLALALAVGLLAPAAADTPAAAVYAFFGAGAGALCAMILPGISGSLLLLLFGFYPHLIEALHQRDFAVIAVFGTGGVCGLALFARLLGWILRQLAGAGHRPADRRHARRRRQAVAVEGAGGRRQGGPAGQRPAGGRRSGQRPRRPAVRRRLRQRLRRRAGGPAHAPGPGAGLGRGVAVFTQASRAEAAPWLRDNYGIELAGELEPITEGIENSNYRFAAADGARYIFTVIEVWDEELAGWCVRLARHLHDSGEAVPRPLRNRLADGPLGSFAGKPAVVVDFVDGAWLPEPSAAECGLAGAGIARLHRAAASFAPPLLPNPRGPAWRRTTADAVRPQLDAADQRLLDEALRRDEALQASGLPRRACHCDLFRNNFLWRDGAIAGVIDFYFAGEDFLVFDLAVAAIDWTMDEDGAVDEARLAALLAAYRAGRPPAEAEAAAFGDALVSGALRFWLSRLLDALRPRDAYALQPHDPAVFRRRLAQCLAQRERLAAALVNG